MATTETDRAYLKRCLDSGRCVQCAQRNAKQGSPRCAVCLALRSQEQRKKRAAKKLAGICVHCSKLAETGKSQCLEHQSKTTTTWQKTRNLRVIFGLCIVCKQPLSERGYKHCPGCRRTALEKASKKVPAPKVKVFQATGKWFDNIRETNPILALDWKAVKPYIEANIEIWHETNDYCLWNPLQLQWADSGNEVFNMPIMPFYERHGHVVSFEEYMIDKIDFQRDQVAEENIYDSEAIKEQS